jgi:hypothetical protein
MGVLIRPPVCRNMPGGVSSGVIRVLHFPLKRGGSGQREADRPSQLPVREKWESLRLSRRSAIPTDTIPASAPILAPRPNPAFAEVFFCSLRALVYTSSGACFVLLGLSK